MSDKDGCGWVDDYDNEVIEKTVADHGVKWLLESLVNESANDFVKCLVFEWQQISKMSFYFLQTNNIIIIIIEYK